VTRGEASVTAPALRYGRPAPDFSLAATTGATIALSGFKGKSDVVLVFYCYDWGGI